MEITSEFSQFPVPKVLKSWRNDNQEILSLIAKGRRSYCASSFQHERALDGVKYTTTVGEKPWSIIIKPEISFSPANSTGLTPYFISAFEIRQDVQAIRERPKPSSAAEKRRHAINFLAANWSQIVKFFYQSPDQIPNQIPNIENLPCFTEVKLLDGSNLAFVGIGPDGKIIIIDTQPNDPKQRKKFDDYLKAINQLLQNLSRPLRYPFQTISADNLVVFTLMPNFTSSENHLWILPLN